MYIYEVHKTTTKKKKKPFMRVFLTLLHVCYEEILHSLISIDTVH